MIVKEFIDAKVVIGGVDVSGIASRTTLAMQPVIADGSTINAPCRVNQGTGRFHVKLTHAAWWKTGRPELSQGMKNAEVEITDMAGLRFGFQADVVELKEFSSDDFADVARLEARATDANRVTIQAA